MPPIKVNLLFPQTGVWSIPLVAPSAEPLPTNSVGRLHRLVEGKQRVSGGQPSAAPNLATLFFELFGESGGSFKKLPMPIQEQLIDFIDDWVASSFLLFQHISPAQGALLKCRSAIDQWVEAKGRRKKDLSVGHLFTHLRQFEEVRNTVLFNPSSSSFLPFEAIPRGEGFRSLSDHGGVPDTVLIGMPEDMKTANLFSRIFLIRTYLEHFSKCRVILSIGADDVALLQCLLGDMISASERKRIKIVPEPGIAHLLEARLEWVRDGVMLAHDPVTDKTKLWMHDCLVSLIPDTLQAFEKSTGAKKADFFLSAICEGGQYLHGSEVVLVGIDELSKYADKTNLHICEKADREQALQDFADGLGKRVVFVGDLVNGQALYHLDVYMTLLPDGTVTVTDFRTGFDFLKNLKPADLNEMMDRYSQEMVVFEENTDWGDSFYLPLLRDRKKNGPLWQRTEKWASFIQQAIDREAAQLEQVGFSVRRVPGFPFLTNVGGLSYANVNFHETPIGETVMMMPSYDPRLDAKAIEAYRQAGYAGEIIPVSGMPDMPLKYGGAVRCMTVVHTRHSKRITGHRHPSPQTRGTQQITGDAAVVEGARTMADLPAAEEIIAEVGL